jgi:hypothetical protein
MRHLGAGPESILPVVVMDSGLALRAPRNDGGNCVEHRLTRLILDLGKIRHRAHGGADLVQELQAIFAHFWIVVVDLHLLEERIDRRTQFCHRAHRAGKIFSCHGSAGFRFDLIDGLGERFLFSEAAERSIRRADAEAGGLEFTSFFENSFVTD